MTAGNAGGWWRADISWLRPTKANLALLRVPIPAGFRRADLGDFPNAIIPTAESTCHEIGKPNLRARICKVATG
jgi:hypothetical protein